jgi:anthranilate/para-aminobenzoate synthase component I
MITPDKIRFLEIVQEGRIPPLYKEIQYCSPCAIYEAVSSPRSFLLESVKGPEKIARYSFIGFSPCLEFISNNGLVEVNYTDKRFIQSSSPLRLLKEFICSYVQLPHDNLPSFQGGVVGMLGYDFVQYFERLPQNALNDLELPDAHFLIIDQLIAFDHILKKCWIIVCPGAKEYIGNGITDKSANWQEKYDEAQERIHKISNHILKSGLTDYGDDQINQFTSRELLRQESKRNIEIIYEMTKDDYMDIVKKAKEYISAGDIFQANLSQRVSAYLKKTDPLSLYKILRCINPSPFAAFVDFGNYQIVSSSPERLIKVKGNSIETRPIAGTRPRGKDSREDAIMRTELLLNEKERAEHIMLIDLERNDLGRVSQYGTVKVDELMITEDYSHVIHIVSNITGHIHTNKDCFDAIRAAFPGGTITGVPKVRCMEIIDELEPVRRGPYTGSIGYISFTGNMDLNIIIRTFVIKNGMAFVQAGAGIVADSDPEREYYETLKKAGALIKTLEIA